MARLQSGIHQLIACSAGTAQPKTQPHVTGEQCFSLNNVIQDGTGAFHAFGVDFASAVFSPFYWNSNLTNPILFDTSSTGTGFGIPGASLRVAENGKAHILWQDDNNFYYWNPVEQQIINLSESLGPGTFISFPQFSYLDHAGELNFIWTEAGHPNFWHSNEKVTYNLLTKLDMSNISYQFLANAAPVYLFQGTPNMGNAGLFYWDISADSLVPVWSGLIDASNVQYLENSDGKVFVGWIEDSTKLFRLYSSIEGISVLNSTATNENELIFNLKLDDFNNLYATWTEASDTAGKGIDYFAAWPTAFVEGSTNVFLPIIISN